MESNNESKWQAYRRYTLLFPTMWCWCRTESLYCPLSISVHCPQPAVRHRLRRGQSALAMGNMSAYDYIGIRHLLLRYAGQPFEWFVRRFCTAATREHLDRVTCCAIGNRLTSCPHRVGNLLAGLSITNCAHRKKIPLSRIRASHI